MLPRSQPVVLLQLDLSRVSLLKIAQVEYLGYKIALLTIILILLVIVDNVLIPCLEPRGEVIELLLVVRVRQRPIKGSVRDGLLGTLRVLLDCLDGPLVRHLVSILVLHMLVFLDEPLFVGHFERGKEVRKVLVHGQVARDDSEA